MRKPDITLIDISDVAAFKRWLIAEGYTIRRSPDGNPSELLRWKGNKGEQMPILYLAKDRIRVKVNGTAIPFVERYLKQKPQREFDSACQVLIDRFPSMLRKMWAAHEIISWLQEQKKRPS